MHGECEWARCAPACMIRACIPPSWAPPSRTASLVSPAQEARATWLSRRLHRRRGVRGVVCAGRRDARTDTAPPGHQPDRPLQRRSGAAAAATSGTHPAASPEASPPRLPSPPPGPGGRAPPADPLRATLGKGQWRPGALRHAASGAGGNRTRALRACGGAGAGGGPAASECGPKDQGRGRSSVTRGQAPRSLLKSTNCCAAVNPNRPGRAVERWRGC